MSYIAYIYHTDHGTSFRHKKEGNPAISLTTWGGLEGIMLVN